MTRSTSQHICRRAVGVIGTLGVAATLAVTAALPAQAGSATSTARPASSAGAPAATGPGTAYQPTATDRAGRIDGPALRAALRRVTAAGAVGAVADVRAPGARWTGASGLASRRTGQPAEAADATRIASITKPMVATLVMQEIQRGRWTLQTRVGDVWPGLLPGHGNVTLEQLLSHRSGAPDFLVAMLVGLTVPQFVQAISTPRTDAELVAYANRLPWLFTPGTGFSYSNTNYVVLGMLLTKVTHRSVGALLQQRVFAPAGMKDTRFELGPIRGAHLAEYALFEPGALVPLPRFQGSVFGPAGAVVAPPADVDAFFRSLFTGRLLAPRLVREMERARTLAPGGYGLGLYSVPDPCLPGRNLVGHDGASFGTLSLALSSPDGRRQMTISYTGRDDTSQQLPAAAEAFAYAALTQACPSARSAAGATARTGWSVPAFGRPATATSLR